MSNIFLNRNSSVNNYLTLILACIIYWQTKEINRVVMESDPEGNGINLKLREYISPITWDNVILNKLR